MTPPDSVLHQQVNGTFIGPVVARQDQPQPIVVPIDWNAYDVPRLWDIVRGEDDAIAWEQAKGFENLAQLLLAHHDSLKRLRDSLGNGWSPETSPAAATFFGLLDNLIYSMAKDAIAHASTGRGMHAVLSALKTAKEEISQLKQEWDQVTTDWTLEWWDQAAGQLNQRARAVIAEMDAAVGDHRQQMTIPSRYIYPTVVGAVDGSDGPSTARAARAEEANSTVVSPGNPGVVTPPPPIPGRDPVLHDGPELQGVANRPQMVAAVPGSPISLLPMPPGHAYAPGGGAYVLPGPGIGRGRWIYSMPQPTPAPSASTSGAMPSAAAGRTPANTPAAMPIGNTPGRAGGVAGRPGKRTLVWQIASGVPPIIGQVPPEETLAEEQLRLAQAGFADWFADLATPWTDDLKVEFARPEPSS